MQATLCSSGFHFYFLNKRVIQFFELNKRFIFFNQTLICNNPRYSQISTISLPCVSYCHIQLLEIRAQKIVFRSIKLGTTTPYSNVLFSFRNVICTAFYDNFQTSLSYSHRVRIFSLLFLTNKKKKTEACPESCHQASF